MKIASVLASVAGLAIASAAMAQGFQTYGGPVSPAVPIPDNNQAGASVSLDVASNGFDIVGDIYVEIIVRHTWQGDLRITLTSPGGTTVVLTDRPGVPQSTFGFSADNFGDPATGTPMIFDRAPFATQTYDAPHIASPGITNVTGAWLAEGDMATFIGENKVGVWTLRAVDSASGDTGSIEYFALTIGKIPAPGAAALLGLGGLVAARRRRN